MGSIFELNNISIRYGFKKVVEGLSLTVEPGQAVALLGLNGAGKSSLMKAVLGIVPVSSGTASVLGVKPGSLRALRSIGFVPEEGHPPGFLSGWNYLDLIASLKISNRNDRRKVIAEFVDEFDLDLKKHLDASSKGAVRRLLMAQAFLGEPKLLVLDEPFSGLDALVISRVKKRLQTHLVNGGGLVLSTHSFSEVEKICTHACYLRKGRIELFDTVEATMRRFGDLEKCFLAINSEKG